MAGPLGLAIFFICLSYWLELRNLTYPCKEAVVILNNVNLQIASEDLAVFLIMFQCEILRFTQYDMR
jgi:hypothetical protein